MFTPFYSYILIISIVNLNIFVAIRNQEDDPSFMDILIRNSKMILNDTLSNDTLAISNSCKQEINNTYITGQYADQAFHKTSEDSSKNKNDVGSYNDCVYDKTDFGKNFTYLIISIKRDQLYQHTDTRYETGTYLFGMCVITGCNESENTEIFYDLNKKLDNPFSLTSKDEVNLYDVEKNKNQEISWMILVYLIPFYLFLIQLLFIIFPEIPGFLFKKCFKKKKGRNDFHEKEKMFLNGKDEYSKGSINRKNSDDNEGQGDDVNNPSSISHNRITKISSKSGGRNSIANINKNLLFKFKSAFDIVDNSEELFNKKPTSFNNESGLQYLKGIRGICMIFLIIGNTFIALFNSPAKIYEEKSYINLHERFGYSILFVGIRYAPRILFSCSGFSFIYKLLSYLGEKEEALINNTDSSEVVNPFKFGVFLRFMMKQLHKYLLYVFVIVFFKYSVYYVIFFTCEVGPLSVYYKLKELDPVKWYNVLGHIFLFMPYKSGIDSNCLLDFFWMTLNEITFFIISTLIIFVFYNRKWRFDLFFLILFVLLFATKFGLFFIPWDVYYPTVFYYHTMFGYFFRNPLYNYNYYILGIFFGLVNYAIQNNITKIKIAEESNKNYLFSAIRFIKIFNKKSKFFYVLWSIFGLSCIMVCSHSIQISLRIIGTNDNLKPFYENLYLNLWLLFDIELVVFLVNFVAICLYFMGVNIFLNFISHSVWISFSRSYFTFVLVNNPLIICFLYQSQSRIQLNFLNIFFFGFTYLLLNILLCWICYITFEFPWKRINKLIMEEKKEDDRLESDEN